VRLALFHHLPSGGALRLVAQSARLLADRGHEVGLFTFASAEQEFAPWPLEGTREVVPLEITGPARFRAYARATKELAARIHSWGPDAVWVEKCRMFGHPPILTQLTALTTVLHTHEPLRIRAHELLAPSDLGRGSESAERPRRSVAQVLQRAGTVPAYLRMRRGDGRAIRAAGRVMTSSRFTQEWLRRCYGVEASILAPGVDTEFLAPAADTARARRVVSVGRVAPVKGYRFILRVLAGLAEDVRPAWDIICDDEDRAYADALRTEAVRAGVAMTIHRRIGEERLRELYRGARAVLCAAEREPFGLVPPEAMACGTPVLAVRDGGFAETVVDGETGWLLPRDEDAWRAPLLRALGDDALIAQMGGAGVARVREHWSLAGWVERAAAASGLAL
jgi:glycosyltransferase involved in cell wall biosynthesis